MRRREFLNIATTLATGPAFPAGAEQNPNFKPPLRVEEIFRDLAQPLHSRLMRDRAVAAAAGEGNLSGGYSLITEMAIARQLDTAIADFHTFMSVSMDVQSRSDAYRITCRINRPDGCPQGAAEAFHLRLTAGSCEITGRGTDGIRRALIYLEDLMLTRGGPFLEAGDLSRWAAVEDRITRSPIAPYRWLSGWELEQERDFYPEEYLNKLAHCGMNGIWVAGLLSRMLASKVLPELGPSEHQIDKLQRLTQRARRYGIRTYLFCIEPRALPADHPVLVAHPEIRGAEGRALCVSSPLVRRYIRETMRELFTAIPDLAGVINIFNGERMTTCWTSPKLAQSCPRCRNRSQGEVLADSLNSFQEGMREASSTARLVAWGYSGNNATGLTSFLPYLHQDIAWMGNFEHGGEKTVHGKRVEVHEYSLSSVGPSATFAAVAREMISAGRTVFAKLQIGNTYELSSVPYLPVPRMVYDKLAAIEELGVKGAMMSWIIGGYPSPMLKVAGDASFAPRIPPGKLLARAAVHWGPPQSARVVDAWEQFTRAFELYLCAYEVFYFGPVTRCPAYQLHLEREAGLAQPYNWGLTRDRVAQPFEDQVPRWLGPFTAEEMIDAFREMGSEWAKGLAMLEQCLRAQGGTVDVRRQYAAAAAARLQFLSMANVIEFYTLRNRLLQTEAAGRAPLIRRMRAVTEDDIGLAETMKPYLALDCTIGFQSEIYDYSYSDAAIAAKIRHDRDTAATLARWENEGVDAAVLKSALPRPALVPRQPVTWREWLNWGD